MAISLINSQIEWTEKQILAVQGSQACQLTSKPSSKKTLKWTGTKTELVELIYALHALKCFKNASLKELFDGIGELFECKIKNYSRLFWGIIERMKGERTIFIDKLKRVSIKRFEKSDEKPSRK